MFRSALYEYTHDYAILGEESGEEAIINYVENQEQPELIHKPINQYFQNFSKLLQQQKDKQRRRSILQPIDTNMPRTTKSSMSPKRFFHTPKVPSVEKILTYMPKSTNITPKVQDKNKQFYERQIRWLSKVKQTIEVKTKILNQKQIRECSFKPLVSPQKTMKKCSTPLPSNTKQRKLSYTYMFNKKPK
ncbi:hypothetical protein pb186bvf_010619 [Paramecium bursaria]